MSTHQHRRYERRWQSRLFLILLLSLLGLATGNLFALSPQSSAAREGLKVTVSFAGKEWIGPTESIEVRLNRPLPASDGTLAVFLSETDITSLFNSFQSGLRYSSQALPLPVGVHVFVVYLISPLGEWVEVARLPVQIRESKSQTSPASTTRQPNARTFDTFVIKPSVTVNLKAESTVLFFPDTSRPDRLNFTDLSFQGSLQTSLSRGDFSHQNEFEFVGTTFQKEALRFGEKNNDAPQFDLSSYLLQVQVKKIKVLLGHHSYGSNRYLINNFSSRGVDVTLPLGSRFDFSFNATNGTSIVGWNNFSGLAQRKHKVVAATVGSELFPSHPGWLRLELGVLRGSLLPLNNFNQRNLTDAETSHGAGGRIVATDSKGRLRVDAGYAQSRFGNPVDPLLSQGFNIVPVRETSRNAAYADLSYQLLKDRAVTNEHKANLSFAFRFNRVDPLFRSVAVFTQADRLDSQYELTGNFGEITAGLVHTRLSDNLDNIPSILKTLTRRNGFTLGVPLVSILGNTHAYSSWLPRLSYNYERTHAFGAFLPINSGFALTHVPDQASTNQNFNAECAHDNLRFGYRFNISSQDNREVGRENADFGTRVNALTFGYRPQRKLDLNFDLSSERLSNFEMKRLDRAWRLSFGGTLQTTSKSILSTNVSSNLASDDLNVSRNRSLDFDAQWSWRFGVEKDKYRKVQGQFFIRYANRYARAQDRIFLFDNLTKFQAFSAGLSITLF